MADTAEMKNGEQETAMIKVVELRDWFAGQALGGILANAHFPAQGSGEPFDQFAGRVTDIAYRVAEAMMCQARRLKNVILHAARSETSSNS
jgi:hypothetical protein